MIVGLIKNLLAKFKIVNVVFSNTKKDDLTDRSSLSINN